MTLVIAIGSELNYISAVSPTIIRQQMKDETLDLIGPALQVLSYGDIRMVNYISDGKTLDASLWLHSAPHTDEVNELRYGILIDSDLNQGTGWDGVDYEVSLRWSKKINKTTNEAIGTWEKTFFEHTMPGISRILSETNGSLVSVPEDQPYVPLSANLSTMGFPNTYRVIAYAEILKEARNIDFSGWMDIPPTEYTISTFPESIELRQGDQKNIGVQLISTSGSVPNIVTFEPIQEISNIKISLRPNKSSDAFSGNEPTQFDIEVPKDVGIGRYTIPILVNISSTDINFPSLFSNVNAPSSQSNITRRMNLTLTVQEPLTFPQMAKDFWDTYGGFISFLGAGFVGGAATYTLDYVKKSKR